MIPEGWRLCTLSELAVVERGKFSARPRNDPRYYGGETPFVQTGDVSSSGTYLERFSQTLNADGVKVSKVFGKGSILLTIAANIGETAIASFDVACPDSVVAVQPIDGEVNTFWLKVVLETKRRYMDEMAAQNAQKNINLQVLKPLEILTPPLVEQDKVAAILSAWDEAVIITERLIEANQQQRNALSQQLLTGKRRLPGFVEEWQLVKMGDIAKRVSEKNNGQSNNVVTISGKRGLIRQTDFFNKSVASETLDGYTLLRKGQFAYNKSYSDGYPMGAIKRLNLYDDAVVTSLYICFEVQAADACEEFMEHYFESGVLNRGLKKVAAEGGRAHGLLNVKPSDFFDLRLSLPPKEEQKAIAKVLSHADAEIEAQQRRLDCLRQEKKALMQQLLTGKRRVKVEATALTEEAAC